MKLEEIYSRALALEALTVDEGLFLWEHAPLEELSALAHEVRLLHVPGNVVTWQIDRNINISNLCVARCDFCNFHAGASRIAPFTTSLQEYDEKIAELLRLGGDQVLLQGGLHPKWHLQEYVALFRELKRRFPSVKLHALGPPEIVHIARQEGVGVRAVLEALREAGLASLPGAGAEILSDRVRELISPRKCSVNEWLGVMREAHLMGLLTSATMMYGHVETLEERLTHLRLIRELQAQRPAGSPGFMAFIAWPCQGAGTRLALHYDLPQLSIAHHIRWIALSRLMLCNIAHIQASWLTLGVEVAQLALTAGADDMGSIMIEEHVVRSAGASHHLDAASMQAAIRAARFVPQLRDQAYRYRDIPCQCDGTQHPAAPLSTQK